MEWLKRIFDKIFNKNQIKLIAEPIHVSNEKREDFLFDLKQQTNLECNDGNGYGIFKILSLKDMV